MACPPHLTARGATWQVSFNGAIDFSSGTETFIAYLPLAHILELTAEFCYYCTGNRIGYCDPKSLLGGPERAYPHGGLEEFKPTLMAGGTLRDDFNFGHRGTSTLCP